MRLFCLLLLLPFLASAKIDNALQSQLLQMAEVDQAVRKKLSDAGWHDASEELRNKVITIDKQNTLKLKALLSGRTWFTKSEVGESGISAAFLIVQHSADYKFKEKMLPLLKQSYTNGEGITGQEVALLTDRIRINKGQKQLYGTQADISTGKVIFEPIANPDTVDSRRARMKMPSLAFYKKLLEKMYGLKEHPDIDLD